MSSVLMHTTSSLNEPVSQVVRQLCIDVGLAKETTDSSDPEEGVKGYSSNWPIYAPTLPSVPSNAISVGDSEGIKQYRVQYGKSVYHRGIQFLVRSDNYIVGFRKANQLLVTLTESIHNRQVTVNNGGVDATKYLIGSFTATSDIVPMTLENNLYVFSVNLTLQINQYEKETTPPIEETDSLDLQKVLLGETYQTRISNYEQQASTNAIWPLYNGQYIIETFTNAWLATGSKAYLNEALDYVENIISVAVDQISIDSGTRNSNGDLSRPQTQYGAVDAGVPYKGWIGSPDVSFHRQSQFAQGAFRLFWEIQNGSRSSEASKSEKDRAKTSFVFLARNVVEKFACSSGNAFFGISKSIEWAASRTQPSRYTGWWDDKYWFQIGNLMHADRLYQSFGLAVPTWLQSRDWKQLAKIFMGVGPTTGPETGETLSYGLEWHNGKVYIDRENTNVPTSTPMAQTTPVARYGLDTGHANRIPGLLMQLNRLDHGDQVIYDASRLWLQRLEENANSILFENGSGYIETATWMDGATELVDRPGTSTGLTSDDHLGFLFPHWILFATRNADFADKLQRFRAQQIEWEANGKSQSYAGYSYSLQRNTTSDGVAPIQAALELVSKVNATDIWGTL